ncbi:MAG: hypothetical protein JXR62_01595 [Bacilli bacterium]|nr:hypothetical protein [Bacilli bacterium]
MLKNNKGFSIVELLAMIMITTIIIYPLMANLVKNVEVNERLHLRQSATSISRTALYGLEKLDYNTLYGFVSAANTAGDYFVELNSVNCTLFTAGSIDENLCNEIFGVVANNLILDEANFRVFIYNYTLPQTYIDALTDPDNVEIPDQVKSEIPTVASSVVTPSVLRVTVWIEYYNDPPYYVVLSGLIVDENSIN